MVGYKNVYDCIKVFLEIDFIEDLKKFDVLMLIIYGDDDQIVLIGVFVFLFVKFVKNLILKIYFGGLYSLGDISKEQFNVDLLEFVEF